MDPTREEKQNQERQSNGGIGQGINSINNIVGGGFKNPFGKVGSGAVVQTAARGGFVTFLMTNPWVLAISITLIIVIGFTVAIVGFGGAPTSSINTQTTSAPTTIPTPPTLPVEP